QALLRQSREFDLHHVQPTAMLGRGVPLQLLRDPLRLLRLGEKRGERRGREQSCSAHGLLPPPFPFPAFPLPALRACSAEGKWCHCATKAWGRRMRCNDCSRKPFVATLRVTNPAR